MFTLIGLGTGSAYSYSVFALLFPGAIPSSFRDMSGQIPVYFEPAAVITSLVLLGQVLELRARSRTSSAIKALLGLAPKTARVIKPDGTEQDVSGRSQLAKEFASALARRCQSTAKLSKARVRLTNR
jgi:Cu+-exporting ATPase